MDDKKTALIASSIIITSIAIVIAAFFWNRSFSAKQVQTVSENTAPILKQESPAEKTSPQKDTRAIITSVEHSQEQPAAVQPKTVPEQKPENIVRVSLPDPSDTVPDTSTEKFDADEDDEEEDTDDGITIETESDDE